MKALSARSIIVVGAALALSGCVESRLHNSSDFGSAVRQDVAGQINDPDPHYAGTAAPGGADGPRVALAQDRYEKGKVIQPINVQTSDVGVSGGGGGGGGGSGGQ